MPGCAAIGCNNRSEKGYTMKCFPRNEKLRQIWKDRVSRADWEPSHNSFLCHAHFEADQWTITQSGRIKLKKSAIPSIFTITSTRKSPKKRRKLANVVDEDLYIIEYLDDDPYATSKPQNFKNETKFSPTFAKIKMEERRKYEPFVVSDEKSNKSFTTKNNGFFNNPNDFKPSKDCRINVKTEIPSPLVSDDGIDEKMQLICDQEPDKKIKDKSEDAYLRKFAIMKNVNSLKIQENGVAASSNGKRRSRFEIMKYMDDKLHAEAINSPKSSVKMEKIVPKTSFPTFTIKLTGAEEDVTEIVEGLGTEPILKYKTSNNILNSNQNFVTSVISITDRSTKKSIDEKMVPKCLIQDKSRDNMETRSNIINETIKSSKLSVESPEEDGKMENSDQLRKKIKFQEGLIRKLMDQLIDTKSGNHGVITRSQVKKHENRTNLRNDSSQEDNKNNLLYDITASLNQSKDMNKRLTKMLVEHEDHAKTLKLQIRQRDNRIKELNWKLNKASKYLERAEKNTNTYRKKMLSMQSLLMRRKKREERAKINYSESPICKEEKSSLTIEEENPDSLFSVETIKFEDKMIETLDENIVYKTVQDIFDESNDCNDDSILIDNPEDFMRQFAGSL